MEAKRWAAAGFGVQFIGKASFDVAQLRENLEFLLADLNKAKPSSAKGVYLQKISISTTMGTGFAVDQASLSVK